MEKKRISTKTIVIIVISIVLLLVLDQVTILGLPSLLYTWDSSPFAKFIFPTYSAPLVFSL